MSSSYNKDVERKTASMSGYLPKAGNFGHCYCCGPHGAMRERRGLKHGRVTALRRQGKREISRQLQGI